MTDKLFSIIKNGIVENTCNNCGLKDKCSLFKIIIGEIIDNNSHFIFNELTDTKEYNRYIQLSITRAECISRYEKYHSLYLKLLLQSEFNFSNILPYIMDIKFDIWCKSIEYLAIILKTLFIVSKRNNYQGCANFKNIISQLLDTLKQDYEDELLKLSKYTKPDSLERRVISYFIAIHSKLYNTFKSVILKFPAPKDNGEFSDYLKNYTNTLITAMEITVVEAASINRLLVDNKVYISSEVINWQQKYNYNLIEILKEHMNIPIYDIIFTEDNLQRYYHLFSKYLTKAS